MDVVMQAVADSRSGLVANRLAEKGLKSEVWGEWAPLRAGGMAALVVRCAAKDRQAVETVVKDELSHLREVGLNVLEVDYVRRRLLGSLLVDHELNAGTAYDIGFHTLLDGPEHAERLTEMLKAITPTAVREAARTWLGSERMAVLVRTGKMP